MKDSYFFVREASAISDGLLWRTHSKIFTSVKCIQKSRDMPCLDVLKENPKRKKYMGHFR